MKKTTFIYAVLGIVLLVGLFFIIKPQTQNQKNQVLPTGSQNQLNQEKTIQSTMDLKDKEFEMKLIDKKIVSGENILQTKQGDEIIIKITSDEAEEFHIHGYDNSLELIPGKQVELKFTANISGRFPFELEHSGTEIGALEVQPK